MNNEVGFYTGVEKNKNPIVFDTFINKENENVFVLGKPGKGHNFFAVTQSLELFDNLCPKHFRTFEHKYKSNNWLKSHGKAMRRKPFKREFLPPILDEMHLAFHK